MRTSSGSEGAESTDLLLEVREQWSTDISLIYIQTTNAKYQNEGRESPMRGWSMTDIVSKIEKRLGKHAGQIARDYIINQTLNK